MKMNRLRESGRLGGYERSRSNKYPGRQGFSRNKGRYNPYVKRDREEASYKDISLSSVHGNESRFQRKQIVGADRPNSAKFEFRGTSGRMQHREGIDGRMSQEGSMTDQGSCEGDFFYQRQEPRGKTKVGKHGLVSMHRRNLQEDGPSYYRHDSDRHSNTKSIKAGNKCDRISEYIGPLSHRHKLEHDRKVELKEYKSRDEDSRCNFENKDKEIKKTNRWTVTPYKNSRKENDNLAAMVFTVLLDNAGKLKRKELENKLGAEPLTMDFEPKESFRKFLNVYKDIFEIQESPSDEKEEGEISDPDVVTRSNIQICIKHASSSQSCRGDCDNLHVCKFHFIRECSFENCKFGHDLSTDHNRQALTHHFMQHLNPEQVKGLLTDLNHRKGVTIPSICSFYNYIQGCKKPKDCPHLHVCSFIAGRCAFYPNCKRSHNLEDEQPKQVLKKYGIDITPENKDIVIGLLSRGLASKSQGQGENGSASPNGSDGDDTKDERKSSVLEPRSELCEKLLRYWNSARLGSTDSTKP